VGGVEAADNSVEFGECKRSRAKIVATDQTEKIRNYFSDFKGFRAVWLASPGSLPFRTGVGYNRVRRSHASSTRPGP